jgi:hypothetical protein
MKKLLVLLFSLFFLYSSSIFADNFIYHCNFETYFKNSESEPWDNKYIKYTFTLKNNRTISIYDHELDLTYPESLTIYSQNPQLIGLYQEPTFFETLVIDEENSFGTYTTSFTDNTFSGQFGMGKCYLQ